MARNVVTHNTLLYVESYGNTDFASDPAFDSGNFAQFVLNPGTFPTDGIPLNHHKIVAGAFVVMDQAEQDAVDEDSVDEAFVSIVIMSGEDTINSAGWTTVGTAVLRANRYANVDDMRVEAYGMADTTGGAADVRVAWANSEGNGAFGVKAIDTLGVLEVARYNKQPANIPTIPTEYRLQARKGAATDIRMRGWVFSFIRK